MFKSFLMAGYECTYARTGPRTRLDLLKATAHDRHCREDYRLLKILDIQTVREGLAWSQIDRGGAYDFSRFERMMQIAREENIEQIWDLNHFDYPSDIDVFSNEFYDRFAAYAQTAVRIIRRYQSGTLYLVPFNEISYFAYKAGDKGSWAPFLKGSGFKLKTRLIQASIAAMDAIWEIDANVRFIQVDPIFYRTIKPPVTSVKQELEKWFMEIRFMTWDMLSGKLMPELGGHPKYLDIIGTNYYFHNQEWIIGEDKIDRSSYQTIPWNSPDRISVAALLKEVYRRYGRPIVMTESGWSGKERPKWWKRILAEVDDARQAGVPLEGICIYPILDMFDWHDKHLTHPGVWDFDDHNKDLTRIPHRPSIDSIKKYFEAA